MDLKAAHTNGISSAGVLWGYGSQAELERKTRRICFRALRNGGYEKPGALNSGKPDLIFGRSGRVRYFSCCTGALS